MDALPLSDMRTFPLKTLFLCSVVLMILTGSSGDNSGSTAVWFGLMVQYLVLQQVLLIISASQVRKKRTASGRCIWQRLGEILGMDQPSTTKIIVPRRSRYKPISLLISKCAANVTRGLQSSDRRMGSQKLPRVQRLLLCS